jgi:hypothetical protein
LLPRYGSVLSRRIFQARRFFRAICSFAFLAAMLGASHAFAQTGTDTSYYARANTLGVFGAYSPDSSHMLLGDAEHRMLLNIGISYNRRLHVDKIVNWQYSGEILPVALESDPLTRSVNVATSPVAGTFVTTGEAPMVTCAPFTDNYNFTEEGTTFSGADTFTCSGRRWTIGEAISPIGMQWNFFPRHKTQAFFEGHGGYMYSTQQIPIAQAGSFNFTLDLGAGFEVYRSETRSVRAEFRYHHISNHGTAEYNPGIDNGLFQVTYCFRLGRK